MQAAQKAVQRSENAAGVIFHSLLGFVRTILSTLLARQNKVSFKYGIG